MLKNHKLVAGHINISAFLNSFFMKPFYYLYNHQGQKNHYGSGKHPDKQNINNLKKAVFNFYIGRRDDYEYECCNQLRIYLCVKNTLYPGKTNKLKFKNLFNLISSRAHSSVVKRVVRNDKARVRFSMSPSCD